MGTVPPRPLLPRRDQSVDPALIYEVNEADHPTPDSVIRDAWEDVVRWITTFYDGLVHGLAYIFLRHNDSMDVGDYYKHLSLGIASLDEIRAVHNLPEIELYTPPVEPSPPMDYYPEIPEIEE